MCLDELYMVRLLDAAWQRRNVIQFWVSAAYSASPLSAASNLQKTCAKKNCIDANPSLHINFFLPKGLRYRLIFKWVSPYATANTQMCLIRTLLLWNLCCSNYIAKSNLHNDAPPLAFLLGLFAREKPLVWRESQISRHLCHQLSTYLQ